MARLFTSGFEVASNTNGHEWTNVVSPGARNTAVARSGDASGRVNSPTSATPCGYGVQFVSALASGPYWLRFALRVDTRPSAANTIAAWIAGASPTSTSVNDGQIRLNADGTLALFAADSQVGSASAVLTVGQWYVVGMAYDNTPGSGSKILRAYLDGTEFAGSATLSDVGGTASGIALGLNLGAEAQTVGDIYIDDVAVNDDTGSVQNGMPTVTGRVVVMRPDSAGDANQWNNTANAAGSTSNFGLVDETAPNDATDMVQSGTLNNLDLYNLDSPGIGNNDTIHVVHVHLRRRNNTADAATSVNAVVVKASGGTQATGVAVIPNTTTWRTGSSTTANVVAANYTGYLDPDGAAWTTATLGTMQAGPKIVAAGTNRVQVSTVWVTVEYTPAPATRWYLGNAAEDYAPSTIRGTWDDASATLVRRLTYMPTGAAATAAVAETSTTDDWDVLLGRWVSDPAQAGGSLDGYLNWVIGAAESNTAANMVWHLHAYVLAGSTDTVRGTLRANYIGSSEWPTTANGRAGTGVLISSPVSVQVGDRVVVEVGYRAQNTVSTSYTGTINYGNTGVADLRATATSVTTDPGWIEVVGAETMFGPNVLGGGAVAAPAPVAAMSSIPTPRVLAGRVRSVLLPVAGAIFPDGSASNLGPSVQRVKSSATAPGVYFMQACFDAGQLEQMMWPLRMPADYTGGLVLRVQCKTASATSGTVVLVGRVAATSDGDATDLDAKAFGGANTGAAAPVLGTAGHLFEVNLPLADTDSAAAGDDVVVYLGRDGASGSDTAAGDLEVVAVTLEYN